MSRIKIGVGGLALAAALVAGCSAAQSPSASPATPTDSAAPSAVATAGASQAPAGAPAGLLKEGEVSACITSEAYPPLEYFDVAGELTGFEVEAFKAVAGVWGVKPVHVTTTFEGLIPGLQAQRCDLVWAGLYLSEKRMEVADAVPELATGQVLLVPAGNPGGIKAEGDVCGKKIAIQSGGIVEQTIAAASEACVAAGKPAIDIQAYQKVVDEFQQIALGRVNAVWETDMGVAGFMGENPGKYEIGYAFPKTDKFAVYLGKGKTEVQEALAAALRTLKADGTLLTLAEKYSIDPATLEVIE